MTGPRVGAFGVALTKGDLYTLDANGELMRVVVGADGKVLAASAAAAGGFDWIFPTSSVHQQLADAANAFGVYRVRNIANAATSNHTLFVPDDFESLLHLYVAFIPNATQNTRSLSITPQYALPGELSNTHSPGATVYINNYTGGLITLIDVASSLAGTLLATQAVGMAILNTDASTMSVLGTIMVYRRKAV